MTDAPLSADAEYVVNTLFPEMTRNFRQYSKEYRQDRDLGVRGEFVGLYRKTRKLKTVLWDGISSDGWREDIRTILLEVASHALLAVKDLDDENAAKPVKYRAFAAENVPKPTVDMVGRVIYNEDESSWWVCTGNDWVRCSPPPEEF